MLCAPKILTIMISASLIGCASRPENVFLASHSTVPGAETVDMLVDTNRRPALTAGVLFGGERDEASFAEIAISIPPPPAHKIGYIEWPQRIPANPAREFATVKAEVVDKADIVAALHRRVLKSPDHS